MDSVESNHQLRGWPPPPARSLTRLGGHKRKGIATLSLHDGSHRRAKIHWYEAHGIGRKEIKIKRVVP